jgi:hypothetical protein
MPEQKDANHQFHRKQCRNVSSQTIKNMRTENESPDANVALNVPSLEYLLLSDCGMRGSKEKSTDAK